MSALFSLCKVELQAMLNAMHLTGSKKSRAFAAPLAAALGTALMGAAVLLPAVQPHRPGRKNKRKDKQKGTRKKEEE